MRPSWLACRTRRQRRQISAWYGCRTPASSSPDRCERCVGARARHGSELRAPCSPPAPIWSGWHSRSRRVAHRRRRTSRGCSRAWNRSLAAPRMATGVRVPPPGYPRASSSGRRSDPPSTPLNSRTSRTSTPRATARRCRHERGVPGTRRSSRSRGCDPRSRPPRTAPGRCGERERTLSGRSTPAPVFERQPPAARHAERRPGQSERGS